MITQIKKKITQIKYNFSGQGLIEYFVILSVMLAVILSTGFIGNMRTAFKNYFNQAVENLK